MSRQPRRAACSRAACRHCAVGGCESWASGFQWGHVEPAPLGPALESQLGKLYAFRAFEQVPAERRVVVQVTDEQLPFDLERVVVVPVVRHFLPCIEKINGLWK